MNDIPNTNVLVPGPFPLTNRMVIEFVIFVDWMLDMRLTEDQQDHLRRTMIKQWLQNDKASIELVVKSLTIFHQISKANEDTRTSWRKQNQTAFVALLRKTDNPLASALIYACDEKNMGLTTEVPRQTGGGKGLVAGLLGLVGAAILSSLQKKNGVESPAHNKAPSFTPEMGGGVGSLLNDLLEMQRKDEAKAAAKDPALGAKKKVKNQQDNARMFMDIANSIHRSNMGVINNIRG